MRRRLQLALVIGAAFAAVLFGYSAYRGHQAEELVLEAEELLSADLVAAPELDRLHASEAESLLRRAEKLGSRRATALRVRAEAIVDLQRGDLVFAASTIESAAQSYGWDADLHVVAAEVARRKTDLRGAREHIDAALEFVSDHPRALLIRADLALDVRNGDAAEEALDRLAELVPDASVVHNRRALAQELRLDFGAARTSLERALDLSPRYLDAWINLGRIERFAGDAQASYDAFDAAVGVQHSDPDAVLGRGLSALELGLFEQAETDFRRSAELAPNDAEPVLALGDLFREQGDLVAAIAAYRQALEREAADAASWLKLGNALVAQRQPELAVRAFEEAIRRAPNLAPAHNGMGAALMHLGDRDAAEDVLSHAAALDRLDPNPLLNLGLLREQDGDRDGALAAWREALERDPRSDVARSAVARLGG
ncbi:MAG: tetratricopeptide repeat protein [Myxococcota bacterium]